MHNDSYSFTCTKCGEHHEVILCFGAEYPVYYFSIPPEEREKRIVMNQDLCVVDDEQFFIRGRITIPIKDAKQELVFNVWTSLSRDNFIRVNDMWDEETRTQEPPYFGWLQTSIPGYINTVNIKTLVHTQQVGFIPEIEVVEENHPLQLAQLHGITIEIANGIAEKIIHRL